MDGTVAIRDSGAEPGGGGRHRRAGRCSSSARSPGSKGRRGCSPARLAAGARPLVLVVGDSLADREETLSNLHQRLSRSACRSRCARVAARLRLAIAGLGAGRGDAPRAQERLPGARAASGCRCPAAKDEIRRLGETLNEMLARLEESFQRERRFVADASHELRTPLAVIEGRARSRDARRRTRPRGSRIARLAASRRRISLAQLAEDLLVLIARAADGRLPVSGSGRGRGRCSSGSAIASPIGRASRGATIELTRRGGLALPVDPLRVRQALGNLVDNALRHGGGEIGARGAPVPGAPRSTSATRARASPRARDHAFERFTRGGLARTRTGPGSASAIVRAIAEAHGGPRDRRTQPRRRESLAAPRCRRRDRPRAS